MKSRFILLLFLFMTFASSLLAFDNKYFSVKDSEWELKKQTNTTCTFMLKNYTPAEGDETGRTPFISVMIEGEEKDTLYVVSYSQKELSDFTSKLENNGFKEYLESDKKETRNFIEKKYPNAPRSKVDEVLKEVYANSKITSSSIVKIGNSKAYCVDFNIVSTKFRRFAIPSLHRVTAIEFAYPETFDLESSKAYKDFVSSYKNKDQAPSSFNGFLYGTLGPNLLRLLIFVAIAIGTTVLKKLRGY